MATVSRSRPTPRAAEVSPPCVRMSARRRGETNGSHRGSRRRATVVPFTRGACRSNEIAWSCFRRRESGWRIAIRQAAGGTLRRTEIVERVAGSPSHPAISTCRRSRSLRAARRGCFTGELRKHQLEASIQASTGVESTRSAPPLHRAMRTARCHCRSSKRASRSRTSAGKSPTNLARASAARVAISTRHPSSVVGEGSVPPRSRPSTASSHG